MPIYEFRCAGCGHVQEILTTSSNQEVELKCQECQGDEMERVLSTVSYSMGSSGGDKGASPCATTRTCAPGKSCTTLQLPGYTR